MNGSVLIIDDEPGIRRSLRGLLEDEGYHVSEAQTGEEGIQAADEVSPDLIMLDIVLGGIDGLEVLASLVEKGYEYPIIVMSGHATLDNAIRAIKLGATNFLEKPLAAEKVLAEVSTAVELGKLRRENENLKAEIGYRYKMVGESPVMQRLRERIRKVAPTKATVLILGESGTGKELVARAVHADSDRVDRSFVQVNCAAIPKDLIESELFGHEKGAFTGATSMHRGRFEQADGGSIFLDEVADTSLETQARLLRVLQEGEVQRVGSEKIMVVDVRVVAASNQNLALLMEGGRFREDLYYRLNVLPIQVPPLRNRLEDIPALAAEFISQFARVNNRHPVELTASGMEALMTGRWPGNVRELKNAVERLMILHEGMSVGAEEVREILPSTGRAEESSDDVDDSEMSLKDRLEAYEVKLLTLELQKNNGVVSRVAEQLNTDRANLYRKLKRYGLK